MSLLDPENVIRSLALEMSGRKQSRASKLKEKFSRGLTARKWSKSGKGSPPSLRENVADSDDEELEDAVKLMNSNGGDDVLSDATIGVDARVFLQSTALVVQRKEGPEKITVGLKDICCELSTSGLCKLSVGDVRLAETNESLEEDVFALSVAPCRSSRNEPEASDKALTLAANFIDSQVTVSLGPVSVVVQEASTAELLGQKHWLYPYVNDSFASFLALSPETESKPSQFQLSLLTDSLTLRGKLTGFSLSLDRLRGEVVVLGNDTTVKAKTGVRCCFVSQGPEEEEVMLDSSLSLSLSVREEKEMGSRTMEVAVRQSSSIGGPLTVNFREARLQSTFDYAVDFVGKTLSVFRSLQQTTSKTPRMKKKGMKLREAVTLTLPSVRLQVSDGGYFVD